MKKLVLFLLMCTIFTVSFSATKQAKPKRARIYVGDYIKASNTFSYKKDNLIFPDKTVIYTLRMTDDSFERIYNYLRLNYELRDDQKVNFEIVGSEVSKGVIEVYRVNNYTIPDENLKGRENYILFGQ